MTPIAITMMIIAMLVVWGGLTVAIVFLRRHPVDDNRAADTLGGGKDDQAG